MRVVLAPDDRSPVAAFYCWVKVGSADERDQQGDCESGLAHVLEHMLFKGTAKRGVGEIAQEIEGSGGDVNAYTSFDSTVFYCVLASRFFDQGLDVLVDAVTRPLIDATELEREKEVILEEIKRDADQPGRRLSHALFGEAFRVHPYGKPVIGRREAVAGYDRPAVVRFYERWYSPSNMVLVVAGRFDPAEAKKKVAAALAHFRRGPAPKRKRPVEPAQRGFRGALVVDEVNEVQVEAAFHIPALAHASVPALDALAIVLGQGDRSRLSWRVRRGKQLANAISAYAFTPQEPGLFFVSASLPVDRADDGTHETLRETFRILSEGVSNEELERAKTSIEGDAVYERETVQGIAKKVGFYEAIAGGLEHEQRYFSAVRRLTPADLDRAARAWLKPENLTAAALGPTEQSLPSVASIKAEATRAYEQATGARHPKRSKAAAAAQRDERYELPGGASLIVRREPAVPLLSMRAVFLGGLRFEDDATAGMTHLLARVHCKGTSARSFAEIARAVDAMAGGVSGFSGFNSFGLRLDALSRHLPAATELFTDLLQHPTFESREVEEEKSQILEAIKSQDDHPSSSVMRAFTKALYLRHPYRLSMIGEADRVASMKSEDIAAFYRRLAVPKNLSIAVVGDVDPREVVERVGEGLAGFGEGRAFALPPIPAEPPVERAREVVLRKDKEQAHLVLGFLGANFRDPDRNALELIATALSGQGGRLFLELRDKQSLAYSVTAFSQEALDPGYFAVYMACAAEKLPRAVDGVRAELARLAKDGLTQEELDRNKRQLVGSFEIDLQRAAARAANMAFNDRYGLGFREYVEYPSRVLAVTREQVIETARKFLDLDRSVLAVVRPEREAIAVAGG